MLHWTTSSPRSNLVPLVQGVRPNLNFMPTEILDQIRVELRHLIFKETSTSEPEDCEDYEGYEDNEYLRREMVSDPGFRMIISTLITSCFIVLRSSRTELIELFISYYGLAVLISDAKEDDGLDLFPWAVGLSLSHRRERGDITCLSGVDGYAGFPTQSALTAFDPAILQILTEDAARKIHRLCGDWSLQADPHIKAPGSATFWVDDDSESNARIAKSPRWKLPAKTRTRFA
jgi:hypothetical protein